MQVICTAEVKVSLCALTQTERTSPAHVVAIPPAERSGNAEQHGDLISFCAAKRVPDEMRREVAVLERERLALASCRLLPWLVRGVRPRDGGRVRGVGEHRLSGL